MGKQDGWFEVDRKGLRQLIEGRPLSFVVFELFQNIWDTPSLTADVTLTPVAGRPLCRLMAKDTSASGFKNLSHAFTLFAPSEKKSDPDLRGRFNLGEKLVLALCKEALISSHTGTVVFHEDGTRSSRSPSLGTGTVFEAVVRMTRDQYAEVCEAVGLLIPPKGVRSTFNDTVLQQSPAVQTIVAAGLPTVVEDDEGILRRTRRTTNIELFQPGGGGSAWIYEMGIPVVEIPDRWSINVYQKVPLNADRDNVTPAYLREVRVLVLNAMAGSLEEEEVTEDWVQEASGDERATDDAMMAVIEKRFGERRVAYDPSDPESNARAAANGYAVIHGGHLSKGQWGNVRRSGAAKPAGQIVPTKFPKFDPDGVDTTYPEDRMTESMRHVVALFGGLATHALGVEIRVRLVLDRSNRFRAWYGSRVMTLNVQVLGRGFFDSCLEEHLKLFIHEMGHEYSPNHLSDDYHRAICRIGADVAAFLARSPNAFGLGG